MCIRDRRSTFTSNIIRVSMVYCPCCSWRRYRNSWAVSYTHLDVYKRQIASHADVVPADKDNLYPPFGGTVQGDYIVGRGVVDDKGPLMATLYALSLIHI